MKIFILIAITFLAKDSFAQSRGSMEDQIRAVAAAKIVNDRLQPSLLSNPNGRGESDIYGFFGKNGCAIRIAEAMIKENREFTVTTPCGSLYQIIVTGFLGDGDDVVTSAKIERLFL